MLRPRQSCGDIGRVVLFIHDINLENIIFEDNPIYHYLNKENINYIKQLLFENDYCINYLIQNSNNLISKIDAIFLLNYYNDLVIENIN